MREGRFDLIIDLRATLLPLFSGARYAPLWGLREFRLPKEMHEAERNLRAMGSLGVPITRKNLRFYIPASEESFIEEWLASMSISEKCPLIVFNPGATWRPKRWPAESFVELGRRLADVYEARIGVIGYSDDEKEVADAILRCLGHAGLDLSGRISLPRLAAVLNRSALFVTNDTGTLHLASAVGVPTVGIYGPSLPVRYGPWQNFHRIVSPDISGVPFDGLKAKDPDLECLKKLSIDDVFVACCELL